MNDPAKPIFSGEASGTTVSGPSDAAAKTEYEVLQLMRQATARFGFKHFMIARLPVTEQQSFAERLVLSNWPAKLVRDYDLARVFHHSTLIGRLRQTKLPVFSTTTDLMRHVSAPFDADVCAPFSDDGMKQTFAVLLHTSGGDPFGVVLSGNRKAPAGSEAAELYFALLGVFETLERTFDTVACARERLSNREIECLRWAADGKSSDEIAIILGISVYTVSSYFKSATRKLDSVNRMQAIARAMRLKLI